MWFGFLQDCERGGRKNLNNEGMKNRLIWKRSELIVSSIMISQHHEGKIHNACRRFDEIYNPGTYFFKVFQVAVFPAAIFLATAISVPSVSSLGMTRF